MKQSRWVLFTVAVVIAGCAGLELLAQAADPLVGTWELNVAKSRFNPGPPLKSSTRTFEAVANGLRYSGQNVNADGTTTTARYTAYFDGKDHPIAGDPNADTVLLRRVDRFRTEGTFKKAGKFTYLTTRVVSKDGKVATIISKGTNAQGKPFESVMVFDKK